MKNKKIYQVMGPFVFVTMILLNMTVRAQDSKIGLSIGDTAPQLTFSKLVKGSSTVLSDEKITILEFWATWCVPCIAAMPHLSELAEKYTDEANVIAVNVMERTGDQPYSVVAPKVTEFVEKMSEKMRFTVVVDDDEKNMEKKWLRAAGINGIPATIVVKDKKIYWIGHPMFLDKVLEQIKNGSYELMEQKKEYEKKFIAQRNESNSFKDNMTAIENAISSKNYQEAIALTDKFAALAPKSSYVYKQRKLQILLAFFKEEDVLNYLKNMQKIDKKDAAALASFIATQENIPQKINLNAAEIIVKSGEKNTYYLDCLATLQSRLGQFDQAYKSQLKMLNLLIEARKDKPDLISEEVIESNRKKVEEYQKQIKKK
ncbi:TlpA disulfide reductase family protein [Sphingobacterium sp.]|jgi:thiol-disulfide isomerase/thioredoxin|uniref:TlpA family protein disulfide reductase n=1 Tax=Sphingobacterium sp. TaxID=341027 RepID=UPI00289BD6CA|nr:TlpA disulfide reductase family protein [Sphingobacterium sp.]